MTDASAARRPGEPALTALGLGAPDLSPADASPHTFPGGGRWRTEIPSCEGPEALAVVLKEASRLDVPIHRISQGSGVWMLTDAEITSIIEKQVKQRRESIEMFRAGGREEAAAVVEQTDVVLRSTDFPKMQFNQFLLMPYFGPGLLPHAAGHARDRESQARRELKPIRCFSLHR